MNTNQYIIAFCNNVKRIRLERGLSKKEMAEKLNISVKSLSIIEGGSIPKRLSVQVIYTLCDEFEIKASEILKQ